MARIPVDPRLSRMLIEAGTRGCLDDITVLAAALSIPDPRERPPEKENDADAANNLAWLMAESQEGDLAEALRMAMIAKNQRCQPPASARKLKAAPVLCINVQLNIGITATGVYISNEVLAMYLVS